MQNLKQYLQYYFWATYHRRLLDKLLEQSKNYYKGVVLDIGGRDRGSFVSPKDKVEKWIFADIENKYKPDIVMDVCDMSGINNESIDVVNAIELFEHVENPKKGLRECYRVLKKRGIMVLSAPF
ncbi:MAG: class I SAM-dependent methyltransferase, partial [candidate division WOR-3 bacterium]|nr:class I SAM-dependent methyltransferase [candidate division WOR-3 bacterium]